MTTTVSLNESPQSPITTTLAAIRSHSPCQPGWETLLRGLGKTKADDEPLQLETILDTNDLDDALWALRACPEAYHNAFRLFACYCAKRCLSNFEQCFPNDGRPRKAIEAAEAAARGKAGEGGLDAAWSAASAAESAAKSAAESAAWSAAKSAASAAESAAAKSAAARSAAKSAASAAESAAWSDFEQEFRRMCRLEGEYGEVCW